MIESGGKWLTGITVSSKPFRDNRIRLRAVNAQLQQADGHGQGQGLGTSMDEVSSSLSVAVDWAMISTLCPMGLIAATTTT